MNFTHVAVGTNDIEAARRFYDKVLATLGWSRIADLGDTGSFWGDGAPSFMVTLPRNGAPATAGNGTTISFQAPDHASVHAFHEAALTLGMPDEGAVGPRPWAPGAMAAYTRDPDGNKLAVYGMEATS
ncbi:VOC family protein [Primorskyibacter flagellatus]|uniref:VOC family protein n=1 Tax=Primorskyibacter flagellatus TaxID=1387277 RepID=UPI003A944C79